MGTRMEMRKGLGLGHRPVQHSGLCPSPSPFLISIRVPMTDHLAIARAHFLDGVGAFEAGRLTAAEAAFRASLLALPGRPSTLMNLAATLIRARRPAEALPLLDEALAAEPDSTEALCHRGAALAVLGQPGPALAAYDQALRLQPALVPALFQRAVQLNHRSGRYPNS